jgi:hypothetical protein
MKTLVAATAIVAALSTVAAAHSSTDRIDRRQAAQQRSIQEGVRSGEITRHELQRLQAEQGRIRELERRAERDGYVDRYERRRIEAAQDAARRHIAEERRDGERRGHRSGAWERRWW